MMSVKHIRPSGEQQIHQAESIHYWPAINLSPGVSGKPRVTLKRAAGEIDLEGGRVYVMNGDGRTISSYDLEQGSVRETPAGRSREPQGGRLGDVKWL